MRLQGRRLQVAARWEDHERLRAAIRGEVAQALGSPTEATVDNALYAAMRAIHLKQTEASYDEYRIAVFEPGLSPEQRRLLFDGVIEKLDLPLPRGELQPIGRGNSW